jgi:hypothetical protein
MATPINDLNCDEWEVQKPIKSSEEPTTSNGYIKGGQRHFALHGKLPVEAVINPVNWDKLHPDGPPLTPEIRAKAVSDLCVILSDGHIKGDKYQQPGADAPTALVKISKEAYETLRAWERWGRQNLIDNQEKWGLQVKSEEVLDSQFVSQLSVKDDSPAVSIKWFKDKVEILVQNREQPWKFSPGTFYDLKAGSRVAIGAEFRGLRIKPKEWGISKLIANRIYVMTCGGSYAPQMVEGGDDLGIVIEEEIKPMDEDPYAAAAAAAAAAAEANGTDYSNPDYTNLDDATMVG